MRVFVLIWADSHRDDVVEVYATRPGAMSAVTAIKRELPAHHRRTWEQKEELDLQPLAKDAGWIFHAKYGVDEDYSVTVIQKKVQRC